MKNEIKLARVDANGVLQVCLCSGKHSDEVIPLDKLVSRLKDYLGSHGGQGNLQIQILYVDKNGDYQNLKEE